MSDPLSGLFPRIGPWTEVALWHDAVALPLPASPVDDDLPEVYNQRLAPLLLRCLRSRAPEQLPGVQDVLQDVTLQLVLRSSQVLDRGTLVCEQLDRAGIRYALAKGPSIAQLYPTWQDRAFSDLDAYIAPGDFKRAVDLCASLRLVEDRDGRQPRPFADVLCREALNLKAPDGASVDLHHHVPPWYWGRGLTAGDLVETSIPVTLLGRELRCVTPEDNLMIVALHVVSDKNDPGATLLIWRDLVQLLRVVDEDRVVRRAAEVGLDWWLKRVLQELPEAVRPLSLIERLETLGGSPRGLRRLAAMLSDGAQSRGVAVTQPLRLPIGRAALYAAALAVPSREYLDYVLPAEPHARREWWRSGLRGKGRNGPRASM